MDSEPLRHRPRDPSGGGSTTTAPGLRPGPRAPTSRPPPRELALASRRRRHSRLPLGTRARARVREEGRGGSPASAGGAAAGVELVGRVAREGAAGVELAGRSGGRGIGRRRRGSTEEIAAAGGTVVQRRRQRQDGSRRLAPRRRCAAPTAASVWPQATPSLPFLCTSMPCLGLDRSCRRRCTTVPRGKPPASVSTLPLPLDNGASGRSDFFSGSRAAAAPCHTHRLDRARGSRCDDAVRESMAGPEGGDRPRACRRVGARYSRSTSPAAAATLMLAVHIRPGDVAMAKEIFVEMPAMDIVPWTTMLLALSVAFVFYLLFIFSGLD